MARRPITTGQAASACDVCGRTLLRGEQADVFISGGSRRTVCELCVARATHEGWIRDGVDDSLGVRPRAEGRGSMLDRLRSLRESRTREVPAGSAGVADAQQADGPGATEPVRFGASAREPRHVQAVPTNADLKTARALAVFNGSEHPRTVAGVMRSLGAPFVTVRPAAATGSLVSILVGWELCWYRYEVDLADEAAGVRACGQGDELDELEPADRVANGTADEHGLLYPG